MILGFKQKFPDKTATNFKEKILSGTKIHSLRESDRFRAGMSIQMAYGVRTKHYEQFNKGIDNLSNCKNRQRVFMTCFNELAISVDGIRLGYYDLIKFIKNDGFDNEDQFIKWFFKKGSGTWSGFIIHWTDFKY